MATGQEILSYQGNPALGGGGAPLDTSLLGKEINDINQDIMRSNLAWNGSQFQQAVRDRDDVMDMVKKNQIDIDIRNIDRTPLENKIAEIEDIYIKNPDIKNNREAWRALQQKTREFEEMKTAAKTRRVVMGNAEEAYRNSNNPIERQAIAKYIEDNDKKGVLYVPPPYYKPTTFDRKILETPAPVEAPVRIQATDASGKTIYQNKAPYQDANGVFMEDIQVRTPIESFITQYIPGDKDDLFGQSVTFYNDALRTPSFMTPENISSINRRLQEVRNIEGEVQGVPASVGTVDPQTGQVQITATPDELLTAWKIKNGYKNQVITREVPKEYRESVRDSYENRKTVADIALTREQAKTQASVRAENFAQAFRANMEGKISEEQLKVMQAPPKALVDVANTFINLNNDKGWRKVGSMKNPIQQQAILGKLETMGLDPNTVEVLEVPKTNETALQILTLPTQEAGEASLGGVKLMNITKRPERIFAIRKPNDPNSTTMVGIDKEGNIIKTANLNEGVNEKISWDMRYKGGEGTTKEQNKSLRYFNDLVGKENEAINLSDIMNVIGGGAVAPVAQPQYQTIKELNGVRYGLRDGNWYPLQ